MSRDTCGRRARAAGIALGVAADLLWADPVRHHPVAGFGALALALEDALHPGPNHPGPTSRRRGVVFTGTLVGGATACAVTVDRLSARHPALRTASTAAVVWACLGGTSLLRVAGRHADLLERADIDGSRELLPWLCGRDPAALTADDLARAVVESVAENTSDAAVATLFWAAVAGPGGAVAHRAANTLDAMVGHRSERYVDFGWASARLDDVLGWPAARMAGLLTVALAGTVDGRTGLAGRVRRMAEARRVWRRDARRHPSPNAGVVEAATAGALGVRLGGRTPYPYGEEVRPALGTGTAPGPGDVRRAVRLMRAVQLAAVVLAVAGPALTGGVGRDA